MLKALFVTACLWIGTSQLSAQAFVQISSIQARPEVLTCVGPGATTRIRLQIYLSGLPEAVKNASGTAQLAVYSAKPSINKIDIHAINQDFSLTESPALVDFEVNCTGDTLPGEFALAATILKVPEGILIKESTVEPIVRVKIVRPE